MNYDDSLAKNGKIFRVGATEYEKYVLARYTKPRGNIFVTPSTMGAHVGQE